MHPISRAWRLLSPGTPGKRGWTRWPSAYLIQAGDVAVQKFAHAEARAIFANALDILDGLEPTDGVVRQTLDTVVESRPCRLPPCRHRNI